MITLPDIQQPLVMDAKDMSDTMQWSLGLLPFEKLLGKSKPGEFQIPSLPKATLERQAGSTTLELEGMSRDVQECKFFIEKSENGNILTLKADKGGTLLSSDNAYLPFAQDPENIFAVSFTNTTSDKNFYFIYYSSGCIFKGFDGKYENLPPLPLGFYDDQGFTAIPLTDFISHVSRSTVNGTGDSNGTIIFSTTLGFKDTVSTTIKMDAYAASSEKDGKDQLTPTILFQEPLPDDFKTEALDAYDPDLAQIIEKLGQRFPVPIQMNQA